MDIETIKNKFLSNPIARKLFSSPTKTFVSLMEKWNEPWRFFHTLDNHLGPMLESIHLSSSTTKDRNLLEIAAWFHDCVSDPKASDNESESIRYFKSQVYRSTEHSDTIIRLIRTTINYKDLKNDLEIEFAKLDTASLRVTSIEPLLRNEKLLLKEFQFVDYSVHKSRRLYFLDNIEKISLPRLWAVHVIRTYLQATRPKIAIYPGSFNPFHVGHLSVLKEAEKLFDKVIVAVGVNPQKEHPVRQVLDNLKNVLPYHQTELFEGFLHKYAEDKSRDADITIIRGFRSGYDIDTELINLAFMRDMSENLKVIFIAPQKLFDHVSSSAIRQLQTFDRSECDKYLPEIYYPGG